MYTVLGAAQRYLEFLICKAHTMGIWISRSFETSVVREKAVTYRHCAKNTWILDNQLSILHSALACRRQMVAPNGQRRSAVSHLRRSVRGGMFSQPFRAGLKFGAGPPGLDRNSPLLHVHPSFI
jgi:hypothetical protein